MCLGCLLSFLEPNFVIYIHQGQKHAYQPLGHFKNEIYLITKLWLKGPNVLCLSSYLNKQQQSSRPTKSLPTRDVRRLSETANLVCISMISASLTCFPHYLVICQESDHIFRQEPQAGVKLVLNMYVWQPKVQNCRNKARTASPKTHLSVDITGGP